MQLHATHTHQARAHARTRARTHTHTQPATHHKNQQERGSEGKNREEEARERTYEPLKKAGHTSPLKPEREKHERVYSKLERQREKRAREPRQSERAKTERESQGRAIAYCLMAYVPLKKRQ
jgi:hypothetical protein